MNCNDIGIAYLLGAVPHSGDLVCACCTTRDFLDQLQRSPGLWCSETGGYRSIRCNCRLAGSCCGTSADPAPGAEGIRAGRSLCQYRRSSLQKCSAPSTRQYSGSASRIDPSDITRYRSCSLSRTGYVEDETRRRNIKLHGYSLILGNAKRCRRGG